MVLQQEALIVSFSVSQWTARKLDKGITEEVRKEHNASDDAGRYNKLLVAKTHTEKISKVANKARTFHYDNTLAWGNNNERLLPTKNYFDYINGMNSLRGEFDQAVSEFLHNYDAVMAEARVRLNGMFKESDYPRRDEIENKYGFALTTMPVPSNDIRVSLQDETIAAIRKKVEEELNNRLGEAVRGIYERIKEQLQHMRTKLSDAEAVFRNSMFENLNELVDLVPRLNVTNDPIIEELCRDMSRLMADPDAVRGSVKLRLSKAQEVDDMLAKYAEMFQS